MNATCTRSRTASRGRPNLPLRWLVAPFLVVMTSVAFVTGTAHAGIGAAAVPTFPTTVTVGAQSVSASITLRNQNSAPNENDTNTVCNAGDPSPCLPGDPGITLIPTCGQLGAATTCAPAGLDPGVFQLSSNATGRAGTACPNMPFTVTVIDPATGQVRFSPQPPGAHVTLATNSGPLSSCTIDFTFDVVKAPTIDQNPALPGTQTVQIAENTQHSGTTAFARGTSSGVTVVRAATSIATTASGTVSVGGQLTDTAVVSGRVNPQPGATIDFRLYGPNDATCAGAPVFESLGVPYPVAGGPVTSAPFVPSAPGVYRWRASYSGDANNAPVMGACNEANENVTVNPPLAVPTIATTASGNISLGGQLTDTAVVTGRVNPVAGATIDFRLYGPNDATCAGAPVFESLGVPYPVAGGPVTSAPFTPALAGVYRWRATYSGDANNTSVAGACNAANENVTVGPAMPTIATTASPSVAVGGQLTDTAIVSGRVSPLPGATVDFRLYGPNDDTCTGAPVFESLGVPYPVAGGPVTSAAFTPTMQGVYRWRASYSGDANNAAVAGLCNAANENVVVVPAPIVLPGSELPATGSGNGQLIAIGAALVLAGWFLVAASSGRSRRTRRVPLG